MLGKMQRLYWKFIGWLYLKHPKILEKTKNIIPKFVKNIVKRALVKDRSKINREVVVVKASKKLAKVDVYFIGSPGTTNLVTDQTLGTHAVGVYTCDTLLEAMTRAKLSQSEYSMFVRCNDVLDRTILEKGLIYLQTRRDKQFVVYNGIFNKASLNSSALGVVSSGVMERSLVRNSFFSIFSPKEIVGSEQCGFFVKIMQFGHLVPEKLFEGTYPDYMSEPVINFKNFDWGNDYTDGRKLLRRYIKSLKESKLNIEVSDNPFSGIDCSPRPKGDRPRILFVVPWTVIGGSDKVVLDLLKKVRESAEFESIVVTTFDVSTFVGENIWEDDFKACADFFYPGYAFTDYDHRQGLVEYLVAKFSPSLLVVSNSGHGYSAAKGLNIPTIDIHHGELFMKHATIEKELVSAHVSVSEYVTALLTDGYGVSKEKIATIPNGVDELEFNPDRYTKDFILKKRQALGIPSDGIVLLYVGRLAPEKNPILILKSFIRIKDKFPSARVVVVGDGPEKDAMIKFCNKEGLTDLVIFEGFKNNTADYFAIADIFILPSFKEAFGIVAIEALMMGVPVVASEIGELPKIITPGKNGFLANPENEKDFSAKIVSAIKDRKLLGKNARVSVINKFSLTVTSEEYFKLMKSLIKKRK